MLDKIRSLNNALKKVVAEVKSSIEGALDLNERKTPRSRSPSVVKGSLCSEELKTKSAQD